MKQKFFTILITVFTVIVFAGCGDRIVVDIEWYVPDIPDNISSGVVINGVRWATRNVGSPGMFADAPESSGGHFQWNRGTTQWDWGWNGNNAQEWERENDPCPQGWRVPNSNEIQSLKNSMSRIVIVNGVSGMLFGTAPHYLFLPFAGFLDTHGMFNGLGTFGAYWGNTAGWSSGWSNLQFGSVSRASGLSVRCVAITIIW